MMHMEPPARYTNGTGAHQGDKVRIVDTQENCYLRVIGTRGYVTVYHPDWAGAARVYHISEIEPGHTTS